MDNIYIHSKGEIMKFFIKFIRLLNLRTCRRKNNNKLNNTAANKKALRNQYSQGFKNYFKKTSYKSLLYTQYQGLAAIVSIVSSIVKFSSQFQHEVF